MRIILVFDSTESGKTAVNVLEFLGKSGLSGEVYMLYRATDVSPFSRKASEVFTQEGIVASRTMDESKRKLEDSGLLVRRVKIVFGPVAEEVLKLEKVLVPHLIVLGLGGESFIRRLLQRDESSRILSKTRTPAIVCRCGFEIAELPEKCGIECVKCASRNNF